LEQSKNSSFIRSQDETWFISAIADNTVSKRIAYDFVEENWNVLFKLYGEKSFTLSSLVETITHKFNTPYELGRVQSFLDRQVNLGSTKLSFERSIESVKTNIRWMEANFKSMVEILAISQ
jgi:hypothetical protein